MVVGLVGLPGEPAVLHVTVDHKCAVAIAPIHLRQPVEHSALGTKANSKTAIQKSVHVSVFVQNALRLYIRRKACELTTRSVY